MTPLLRAFYERYKAPRELPIILFVCTNLIYHRLKIRMPPPIALPPALPSELLKYILTHQVYPTTLIICSARATFLSSLLESVKHTNTLDQPEGHLDAARSEPPDTPNDATTSLESRNPLLIPTLHQVVASRYITTIFVPTVLHLRAYLTVFPSTNLKDDPPSQKYDNPGTKVPLLVV